MLARATFRPSSTRVPGLRLGPPAPDPARKFCSTPARIARSPQLPAMLAAIERPRGSRYTAGVIRVAIAQELVPHYRVPLFRRLAEVPGVRLHVLADTRDRGSSLRPAGDGALPIRHAPHREMGPFFLQPATFAEALRGEIDILVQNWNLRRVEQVPALLAARARGIGTLLWGHGYSKNERPAMRALRDRYGALADATLFYTEPGAQAYAERGYDAGRIFVAPNAIDQAPIAAARSAWLARPADLAAFACERGLVPEHTAIFVARLEPIKRIDLLLEAFARVVAQLPDAKLVLVGGGPEERPLRERAQRLGIEDAVIFAGAIHDQMQLAPWALNAALMAFPADVGLSILHGFGFGLPMVTDGAVERHNPEIAALRPEANGLFFASGSLDDFAAQMLRIFRDPALRLRLSEDALNTVHGESGYTLDRMVEGFVRALDHVAALRGKRR